VSVVRLIVATRSNGLPASGKIIKEMPGPVASGTPYIHSMIAVDVRFTSKEMSYVKEIVTQFAAVACV